jgi:hypothetical protein
LTAHANSAHLEYGWTPDRLSRDRHSTDAAKIYASGEKSRNGDVEQTLAVICERSGQQLDAEAQQLVCGYQTLEFFGEFAAFNRVPEP